MPLRPAESARGQRIPPVLRPAHGFHGLIRLITGGEGDGDGTAQESLAGFVQAHRVILRIVTDEIIHRTVAGQSGCEHIIPFIVQITGTTYLDSQVVTDRPGELYGFSQLEAPFDVR